MSQVAARLRAVTRRFGSVTALRGAELTLRAGEVHGVLGANGAGKTTLLNVLGGMLRPDEGEVLVGGEAVTLESPRDAWRHGVALVHQHFTLVPALTVLENLALGRRLGGGWALPLDRVRAEAEALMERTGLSVPLERAVAELGVGDRQRTEILKALLREPRVLVLDEPTAVLAPAEIDGLFALLRRLASEGRAVVLVAHKLDEVLAVADRVTVLRDGATVLESPIGETASGPLILAMVGADEDASLGRRRPAHTGARAVAAPELAARLEGVEVLGQRGEAALSALTLSVARGEVVGIAGVEGNGQRELALVLAGRRVPDRGHAELPGGIGFIPQDRTREGVVADFDITRNTALALHREPELHSGPWLRWDRLAERAEELRSAYRVAAPTVTTPVGALSGGNQQRVVVGREISMASDLLVAENPTRGLDVSAAAFVHEELARLTERHGEGPGVVLLSTDLDEVLALSDRIFAMSRGRLSEVPEDAWTREGIGERMLAGGDG